MTNKILAAVVIGLLAGNAPSGVAGNDVELARGRTEIQLVGSGKSTAQGKLFAAIISGAFKGLAEGKQAPAFQISWVEDRELLLQPLLSRKVFDIGFAWEKPDCAATPSEPLCRDFFFSKPIYTASPSDGGRKRTFHAVIAKSHPRARTFLYYINTALGQLKDNGDYEIILASFPAPTQAN
jgi:hypothetical protein